MNQALKNNIALPTTRAEHNLMLRIKESKNSALPSSRAISGFTQEKFKGNCFIMLPMGFEPKDKKERSSAQAQ